MSFLLGIVSVILILDQATKLLVERLLPLYSVKPIIPGFFNLVHVRNTGAAFSMFAGSPSIWRQAVFVGLGLLVVGGLGYAGTKLRKDETLTRWAYALICAGALGNLVDRLRLGEVIDFLDLYIGAYHWPAFNVADSAITIGACLLAVTLFQKREEG
jgi:signal peptidase II